MATIFDLPAGVLEIVILPDTDCLRSIVAATSTCRRLRNIQDQVLAGLRTTTILYEGSSLQDEARQNDVFNFAVGKCISLENLGIRGAASKTLKRLMDASKHVPLRSLSVKGCNVEHLFGATPEPRPEPVPSLLASLARLFGIARPQPAFRAPITTVPCILNGLASSLKEIRLHNCQLTHHDLLTALAADVEMVLGF
ncbi:hypothetical protein WJX73_006310 [Symbiochloris irregularis]|uniref:F-box domain-containing protein n=1 Tax=Symbiochloris irregularis TaxID=706552 RepID=A0AAW1NRP3_9CHLO